MSPETPTLTRSQLRCLCDDQAASPKSRLDAAGMLLDQFGASARNLRIVKRVARTFEKYVAASPRTQQQVRWWSERLKARLERIAEAETTQPEDPDGNETDSALIEVQSLGTPPKRIGNTELLPPDGDDPFWDQPISGSIRRRLFCLRWGLDESLSRAEMIAVLSVDPAKFRAQVTPVLWTRTRDQLDDQFEKDTALIRSALAERDLPDSDDGRAELTRQLEVSAPYVEFRWPTSDRGGTGLPVLVLSAIGRLLAALEFTKTWPNLRPVHHAL
jgi:hypothetical protein